MAWRPEPVTERVTEVFKHKHMCVALWSVAVDQLTDQPSSAQICSGAVWGLWLWHLQATSQEIASGALFSTHLGRQTLG